MEETLQTAKKQFSKLGWAFAVGAAITCASQVIFRRIISAVRPEWLGNANIELLISVVPLYLIGLPALILLLKQIPADTVEKRTMKWWQFVLAALICFALIYTANIIGNIFTVMIGFLKGSAVGNPILNIATSVSMLFAFIYMVLCAPFIEEYIFRKLLVDRTVRYGQDVAVLLSGLMFGLFHGNLNQFAYTFVLGCFLAFLYVKTGKLKIAVALHMMVNFMGSIVSVLMLDMIDLKTYLEIAANGMDTNAMMKYISDNMLGWTLYMIYVFFIFGVMIAGMILFIVCLAKKSFRLEEGKVIIPRGKRFYTVVLNAGMIVYCIFWIAMIVRQLLV